VLVVRSDAECQQSHDFGGYRVELGGRDDGCFGWPQDADGGGVVGRFDQFNTELVAGLLAYATKPGWLLVALDLKIDSTTYRSHFLRLLAVLAEWERDRLAERTSERDRFPSAHALNYSDPQLIAELIEPPQRR
jgi:hypothetical protein